MGDPASVPPHLVDGIERTVSSAFTEAIVACDASSSLARIDDIRMQLRDAVGAVLAAPMRLHNARLSLQNRLPPEVWLNIWAQLPMAARIDITHVCSFWRELAVNSPDLWTALECIVTQPHPPTDLLSHFYSSLDLAALALSRIKGRPLSVTISLHPVYMHGRDQLLMMLRPYAGEIAELDIQYCAMPEFQSILGELQPFSSLQHLRYGRVTLESYGPWPPLFPGQLPFPQLKTLVLPAQRQYHWGCGPTTYHNGIRPVFSPRVAPFPAVETVCFAPAHEIDIAQALHDCPSLTSLSLWMADFPQRSGFVDRLEHVESRLTELHLYSVRAEHIRDAIGLYRVHAPTRHFSVMLMNIPRPIPVRNIGSEPAEIFHFSDSGVPVIAAWSPAPSAPASVNNGPMERDAIDDARTTSAGLRVRCGPKQLYRRLKSAFKGMLRTRMPDVEPQSVRVPPPSSSASSEYAESRASEAPYDGTALSEAQYDATALDYLSEHFRDLADTVDVLLFTTSNGWHEAQKINLALRATDATGRTRTGGLRQRDSDAMPEFLARVWHAMQPQHIACEVELFPLLLASLREACPARSLELLFGNSGEIVSHLMSQPTLRFPRLRALQLGPRYADSAGQTVLSAPDIAAFVSALGAQLPLESITITRGVIAEDPAALDGLAGSIVLRADPCRGIDSLR